MTIEPKRRLGATDIFVSPVALGCWPIAGMTSLGVTRQQSVATLHAALQAGVNFFDTAYCYGADGESERLIGEFAAGRRDQLVIATKGGIAWNDDGSRRLDARPNTLKRQLETSLRRLGVDHVELLYLHAPDPEIPIEDSAVALAELRQEGKTRAVGVSNVTPQQLACFHAVCPVDCIQPPYNMLQRQAERELLPWCGQRQIAACVYWPLMKGLLAGHLAREHVFDPRDGRRKYPMFQGDQWCRNQDFLDRLRPIAAKLGRPLAEVVVNWTIHQGGITAALCGAKRPEQIQETAAAMHWRLAPGHLQAIDEALRDRGEPVVKGAV
jgi:aryl-alcohol dehydrogenase-like predicted oxidoreductase